MPSRRATAVIMWQASKQRRGFVRSTAVIHYPYHCRRAHKTFTPTAATKRLQDRFMC